MLFELINGIDPLHVRLYQFLIFLCAIIISLTIHELCHGLSAYKLGDTTAKSMGRLSLNPLKHIHPVGMLMLVVAGFGWAKPVMVDPRYFRDPKRDMAITALAGPASNFVLAFIMVIFLKLMQIAGLTEFDIAGWDTAGNTYYSIGGSNLVSGFFSSLFVYTAMISTGLAFFNLIPIPPLDGSKVLASFLPERLYWRYMQLERYGMMILIAIILLGGSVFSVIGDLRNSLLNLMVSLLRLPFQVPYFVT